MPSRSSTILTFREATAYSTIVFPEGITAASTTFSTVCQTISLPLAPIQDSDPLRILRSSIASITLRVPKRAQAFPCQVIFTPYAQWLMRKGILWLSLIYRLSYMDTAGAGKLLDWRYRPLEELGLADRNGSSRLIMMNLGLSYKFADWISMAVNINMSAN